MEEYKMKTAMLAAFAVLAACTPSLSGETRLEYMTQPAIFAASAASHRAAEDAMARLALRRAKSAHVTTFARDLLASNETLQAIGRRHGVERPARLYVDQARFDALEELAHNEFDRYFMDAMVEVLRDSFSDFSMAANAPDPAVAEYARAALPMMRHNLHEAQRIDILVGGGLGPDIGH
jgi:predicted outer membrane protein